MPPIITDNGTISLNKIIPTIETIIGSPNGIAATVEAGKQRIEQYNILCPKILGRNPISKRKPSSDEVGVLRGILKRNNIPTVIITKEKNQIIKKRSTKMHVDKLFDGVKNKEKIILKLCNIYNLSENNIAYIGDDVNDLEILELVGLSISPKDANQEVKKIVDYTCNSLGGEGVLREICDLIISIKFGKKIKLY